MVGKQRIVTTENTEQPDSSLGYLKPTESAESLGRSEAGVVLGSASGRAAAFLQQHRHFTQPVRS
jgi:hypothetical protein